MTKTHRMTKSPEYRTWRGMIERCNNPRNSHYSIYGGDGVQVCDRWRKFENFFADMGHRPDGMTLDRYPNSEGDYEPGNCRWATPREQSRNTRRSVMIEWNGQVLCREDWASRLGITSWALKHRIETWGLERAMSTSKLSRTEQQRVLSKDQVAEIRNAKATGGRFWGALDLAKKFGVCVKSINNAATGKTCVDEAGVKVKEYYL